MNHAHFLDKDRSLCTIELSLGGSKYWKVCCDSMIGNLRHYLNKQVRPSGFCYSVFYRYNCIIDKKKHYSSQGYVLG